MKLLFAFLVAFAITLPLSAQQEQIVAKLQMDKPVEGICDHTAIYALMSFMEGQIEAKCSVTQDELEQRLNSEVAFLKENPKYKDKGMVGMIINCKGEIVSCDMDNETKSKVLDEQIVAIFKSLPSVWEPGMLQGKAVDSILLFSFEIKKGVLDLN